MSKARQVTVTRGAATALTRGHPWVWREQVTRAETGLATGDVVTVRGPDGKELGQGLWDGPSPIAVRIYTRAGAPPLDAQRMTQAVERAIDRRRSLVEDADTTAYRLCHGEGDRIPGLVLDRYGDVAVLRLDGGAMPHWLERLTPGLWTLLESIGIRTLALRGESRGEGSRLQPMRGREPPDAVTVRENGMAMVVDLARGQKTGAFLDQRDNRARVRALANGRRTLNLFSYAGGFSIAAALGAATHVTSVDIAHDAHATAQLSLRANGLDAVVHSFVSADVFGFLESIGKSGQTWDLIVSDPPSFAPSEKARARGLAAYRKLHAACAAVLAPGGIFCAASCSSHVTAEDFASTLDDAVLERSDFSLVEMFGPPADHPTLPGWPEGRYLKFAVLR
jgi:23S rRNA (cytosine1962-C5)-methyltransferase